jgi:hypothetical protein
MTFILTFAWWWVPTAITVIGLIWVFFIYTVRKYGVVDYRSGVEMTASSPSTPVSRHLEKRVRTDKHQAMPQMQRMEERILFLEDQLREARSWIKKLIEAGRKE